MSIRIITDSVSDIEPNELKNVIVVPMTITIDGTPYRDGLDISKNDFYTLLETSETMPVTSLVSPAQFEEAFDKVTEAGDEAIVLTVTSVLSGTYQSAVLAANGRPGISVIDTLQVATGQRLLVELAQRLIEEGLNLAELTERVEKEKKRICIFASVDTLKYLRKGGRLSAAEAIVGGMLGIKPILTMDNGKLISIGKARGSVQSNRFLDKKVAEVGGIDFSMPYAVGYSGTDSSNLMSYMKNNPNLVNAAPREIEIVQVGSTVGTHAGPGAVTVAFFCNAE